MITYWHDAGELGYKYIKLECQWALLDRTSEWPWCYTHNTTLYIPPTSHMSVVSVYILALPAYTSSLNWPSVTTSSDMNQENSIFTKWTIHFEMEVWVAFRGVRDGGDTADVPMVLLDDKSSVLYAAKANIMAWDIQLLGLLNTLTTVVCHHQRTRRQLVAPIIQQHLPSLQKTKMTCHAFHNEPSRCRHMSSSKPEMERRHQMNILWRNIQW